jgi:hypothetical protein
MKSAAPSARDSSFGAAALVSPFSVALPGPRSRTDGAGDPQRFEARPGSVAQVARSRSIHLPFQATPAVTTFRTSLADTTSSRAVVTAATSSRRLDPEHSERVDGEGGAQSPVVCGSGAAPPADVPALFAVDAPYSAGVIGGSGRGSEAARFPVVMGAASREQSSRRLIRTAGHLHPTAAVRASSPTDSARTAGHPSSLTRIATASNSQPTADIRTTHQVKPVFVTELRGATEDKAARSVPAAADRVRREGERAPHPYNPPRYRSPGREGSRDHLVSGRNVLKCLSTRQLGSPRALYV